MVVDDQSEVRQLLACTLDERDFLVLHAKSGVEAIALARSERPDLVLLDLLMPEMDGLDVCRVLKADPRTSTIKVFVLTASGSRQVEVAAAGADGFFSKPFSPVALLDKVYEALR